MDTLEIATKKLLAETRKQVIDALLEIEAEIKRKREVLAAYETKTTVLAMASSAASRKSRSPRHCGM